MAYYLQTWFRYYLQQWIEASMSEVESHEGVYSWDYSHADTLRWRLRGSNTDGGFVRSPDVEAVLIGNQIDHIGGIDFSMVDKPLDLSVMTLDWVNATEDPIFKELSRGDSRRLTRILNKIRRSSSG